jgi:hypothetical protein
MGSSFENQDLISTPEAKGMRGQPSPGAAALNAKDVTPRREPARGTHHELPVGRVESESTYARLKEKARTATEVAHAPELLQTDMQSTKAAAIFSTAKLPADFAGIGDTGWVPADCSLAAGPSHLVVATNSAWAVFDKAGNQLLRCELSDWFSNVISGTVVFNPKVIFDQSSGRWVISACGRSNDGERSYLLISASQARNPLGPWWNWALDASLDGAIKTEYYADGLGLGVDNTALYLSVNMFSAQGDFQYAKLRIINKSELYAGRALQVWDFWDLRNPNGTPVFSLQPAHTFGAPGIEYLVNATSDGHSLTQWSLSHPLSQPPQLQRRAIPTVSYHLAPNAKQPGTAREIETGDPRFTGAIFRNGMLWMAHTVAVNWGEGENASAIQWVQINPGAGVTAQQRIYGAPGFYYFCPTMMVDGQSNLIMVFNRAGESEFPSVRFTGRLFTDTPSTLQASALLKESLTAGPRAWGAYNGAAVDPNDTKVWIIGQYAAGESEWATWIGETSYIASGAEGSGGSIKRPAYV